MSARKNSNSRAPNRRGRLPGSERAAREQLILDHALAELQDHGVDGLSMLGVARRAEASKETLYTWFGNRDGLLTAVIERNADIAAESVREALVHQGDARATLTAFSTGLLTLLTSKASIALNRTAMASPGLAGLLLASGRHRIGPIVEQFLSSLDTCGEIRIDDPSEAFELLYGLVVQDTQVRVLLGDRPPNRRHIRKQAAIAVDRFLHLCSPAMRDQHENG